ncbi:MAG: ABC transporter substrate-binding protein, partial [Methylocapsa sp.]|nr:ABC transporter substrate-binding protein [Methylocapsa sp.]
PSSQTILVMRREAALLVAPQESGIHGIEELEGRRVGILDTASASQADDQSLLDTALAQYGVPVDSVQRTALSLAGLSRALVDKRIDAVLVLGVPGSQRLDEAITAIAPLRDKPPVFLPIAEAKAVVQRLPVFEAVEVLRGVFGGAQPKPSADFETLGVSTRLVARGNLANETAGEVIRLILAARPTIAAAVPAANRIEAPSGDKGAAFPIHPGVLAFLDDDEKNFFDKYSDFIYIGAMCLSVLGTAAAAAMARLKRQRAPDTDQILRRLIELIRLARGARLLEVLEACEGEADEVLEQALALDMLHGLSPNRICALDLALNQLRLVVSERRQNLAAPVRAQFVPRVVND